MFRGDFSVASSGWTSGDDYGPPFYVDVDTERVGIGTTAPQSKLSITEKGGIDYGGSWGRDLGRGRNAGYPAPSAQIPAKELGTTFNYTITH